MSLTMKENKLNILVTIQVRKQMLYKWGYKCFTMSIDHILKVVQMLFISIKQIQPPYFKCFTCMNKNVRCDLLTEYFCIHVF